MPPNNALDQTGRSCHVPCDAARAAPILVPQVSATLCGRFAQTDAMNASSVHVSGVGSKARCALLNSPRHFGLSMPGTTEAWLLDSGGQVIKVRELYRKCEQFGAIRTAADEGEAVSGANSIAPCLNRSAGHRCAPGGWPHQPLWSIRVA
jgi:hypothetical protein